MQRKLSPCGKCHKANGLPVGWGKKKMVGRGRPRLLCFDAKSPWCVCRSCLTFLNIL